MSVWKFKLKAIAIHSLISVVVAAIAIGLVYGVWYPEPYASLLAVGPVLLMALCADVISGPLVTAVLANPKKKFRERVVDYSLVGGLQLLALGIALHAMYVARPVAMVYEIDRFVVVSANEVLLSQLPDAPAEFAVLPKFSQWVLGVRDRSTSDDVFQSVEASLAGLGPAMRPAWWVPYEQVHSQVRNRMQPVARLRAARPEAGSLIDIAVANAGTSESALWFIPLTTSQTKEWVVLLDQRLNLLAYAPIDGFIEGIGVRSRFQPINSGRSA